MHNSCTILTFATAFRPAFLKTPSVVWQAEINKAPLKRRAEFKHSVIEHGLDFKFVAEALAHHRKLLSSMAGSLKSGPYLFGREFFQRGLRGNSLYFAARTPQARPHVGRLPSRRRMVGANAHAAVGQGRDLRSHDRGRMPRPLEF